MGRSQRRKKRLVLEEKKVSVKKWIFRILIIVFSLIVILLAGGYIYAINYIKSDEFRFSLENKAGDLLQSEVRISPLVRDGKFFRVENINITGHNNVLNSANIEGIDLEFDYGKLWDKTVHINKIQARDITADLSQLPLRVQPKKTSAVVDSEVVEDAPAQSARPWYASYIPNKYEIGEIAISNFSVKGASPYGAIALANTNLHITNSGQGNGYHASIKGGTFTIPWKLFPEGELANASLRYRDSRISIPELNAIIGKQGSLQLEGTVNLDDSPLSLNLGLKKISLEEILPPDWIKSLSGEANLYCKIHGGNSTPFSYKGNVTIDNGVLTALPILDTLAAFTGSARFRRIEWTMAKTDYLQEGDQWILSNIFLASEGLVRIEGALTIEGENLNGDLMIGLPAGLLAHIPGAEEEIFRPENNSSKLGLLWAPIKISGTLKSPKEDLSGRMITVAGNRLFRMIPGGKKILNFSRSMADQLIDQMSPKEGNEKDKDTPSPGIKKGEDLLNSGIQMGLDILTPAGK